jgi:uncharacterized protein YuzE
MKITYAAEAEAAFIQLVDVIGDGESASQIHSIETPGNKGEVTIEILGARQVLRTETMARTELV